MAGARVAAASAGAGAGGGVGGGGRGAPVGPGGRRPKLEPEQDPAFRAVKGRIAGAAGAAKSHPPAAGEAAEAQGAAAGPANDVASQAKAGQVDKMAAAQPGVFDKVAFIAAVRKAIDSAAPKTLDDADKFKGSGKVGSVKGEVSGLVGSNKDASQKDIKAATTAPPDASNAQPKPVSPMKPPEAPKPPDPVGAAGAMPAPQPAAATDLRAGPAAVNDDMAQAGVTEDQLKKSNEPEFEGALKAKKEAEAHAASAPGAYRADEAKVLGDAKSAVSGEATNALGAMQAKKGQAGGKVGADKAAAKAADEKRRAQVAADIEAKYAATKTDVEAILTGLDKKVDDAFDAGEKAAREKFENDVDKDITDYKIKRYLGTPGGSLLWVKDLALGMPDEVNVFYQRARTRYLADMDAVIGRVADIVGGELGAARQRIEKGKTEITTYVAGLAPELRAVGQQAQKDIQAKFSELSTSIDEKQADLVSTLAEKYTSARDSLDERIQELQDANKGLVDKAKDAVKGAIETIKKLKDMIANVLARAAAAVERIIKDPIGFLGNLVNAVKAGVLRFKDNILTHLKSALMGWLFGVLAETGITLPEKFDLKGILSLVLQLIGLTYANIRTRVVKAVGEPVVSKIEKTVEVFKVLISEGPAGLWKFIKDKLAGLKDQAMEAIKSFLIEKIIVAGITWLISLLNPASAFVKACKAIYDVVMFFVERASQIQEFVNTVLDSVEQVASGAVGGIAAKIESVLAKVLPLLISMLASLLGLGGIGEKIRSIIEKIQRPVNKLIDAIIMPVVKKFKKVFGKGAAFVKGKLAAGKKWVKGKVEAGKKWVKGKVAAGKKWVKGKIAAGKEALTGRPALSPEQAHQVKQAALTALAGRVHGLKSIDDFGKAVREVRSTFTSRGLKSLSASATPNAQSITLAATASEPERREMSWADVFAAEDPKAVEKLAEDQLKAFREQGDSTVAVVSIEGEMVGRVEESGQHINHAVHAETKAMANAGRQMLETARARAQRGERTKVVLAVNRTPCPECSRKLKVIIEATRQQPGGDQIDFVLAATGVYEGKAGVDDATKVHHLEALARLGWDIRRLITEKSPSGNKLFYQIPLGEFAHKLAVKLGRAGK